MRDDPLTGLGNIKLDSVVSGQDTHVPEVLFRLTKELTKNVASGAGMAPG